MATTRGMFSGTAATAQDSCSVAPLATEARNIGLEATMPFCCGRGSLTSIRDLIQSGSGARRRGNLVTGLR